MFAVLVPVAVVAEDVATAEQPAAPTPATNALPSAAAPSSTTTPAPSVPNSAPQPTPSPTPQTAALAVPAADPIVASIRSKLADANLRKGADPADLAALDAFYAGRSGPPVWVTPMGFSAKAQGVINEIGKADEWGLSASAFQLPPAGELTDSADEQAVAEIKLQLAILKYARYARGGRANPASLSKILDQDPPIRDPKIVLAEISVSSTPDAYLQSLHPKHEQFQNLRQALVKARGGGEDGAKKPASERDIQQIVINMERWRWMPEDLGKVYVQDNVPEYMLYVVKDGKTIHADKIVVGLLRYATPVFSADMKSIVFNPEWTVPPTIVRENLLPNLRGGGWFGGGSVLREHGLKVKYNGRVVDPGSINWGSVNMGSIAFVQAPGPTNVLGKLKFVYPNKHMVYMHDTIKRGLFKPAMRAEGHNCIRMERPGSLPRSCSPRTKAGTRRRCRTSSTRAMTAPSTSITPFRCTPPTSPPSPTPTARSRPSPTFTASTRRWRRWWAERFPSPSKTSRKRPSRSPPPRQARPTPARRKRPARSKACSTPRARLRLENVRPSRRQVHALSSREAQLGAFLCAPGELAKEA